MYRGNLIATKSQLNPGQGSQRQEVSGGVNLITEARKASLSKVTAGSQRPVSSSPHLSLPQHGGQEGRQIKARRLREGGRRWRRRRRRRPVKGIW